MPVSLQPNRNMMSTEPGFKTAILLNPQQIIRNNAILQSFHIKKQPVGVQYEVGELTHTNINKCYPELPKAVKEVLVHFDDNHGLQRESGIEFKYKKGRAGVAYKDFYQPALLRELHQVFDRLKPFASLLRWYHKTWIDKTNVRTAPCIFSVYKPQLQFDVVKESSGLALKVYVLLNGTAYELNSFERYHFLLESNNEYFLLSFKDFQTLEWLVANDPQQFATDPQTMALQILAKLEEDYTVNRNGLFTQNIIAADPVNRVLLSEISGSFLVLTPQWLYDGFLVEGQWKDTCDITRGGEAYVVQRDKEAEKSFTRMLEDLHPNFKKQLNGYYYVSFADAQKKQWFLKAYHSLLEKDIQVAGMDMLQHFRYSTHKAATEVTIVGNENNKLTIRFTLSFGTEEIPLGELQKILLAGQKAILLKDGSLGILGDEWLKQYSMIIKHGKVHKKELTVARWIAISEEQNDDTDTVLRPVLKNDWWKRWEKWQEPGTILYPVPAGIAATLRPYQQKGFEWMMLLAEAGAGACLADDMGLGKTLQTICFIANCAEKAPGEKFLIVCPSSLLYNWLQEFQKFAPHLSLFVYHGPQRNFDTITAGKHQVIITTYGTIRSDIERLADVSFNVAVIDESHNIKNPAALITKAVNQVNAITRIALSGTPVMNNTFDLYAQLSFLLPGMFGSREFFKREYADAIDRDRDPDKIKALQKLTAPFILRRTKEQVATDLPDKIETVLWCNMETNQKNAYESIRENVRSSIFLDIKEKGLSNGKLSVINGMLKLRQACNSCELVKDEDLFTYDSIKTNILVGELNNIIPDHKALVFSQFTGMLDLLEPALQKNGIPFMRLDGSTPVNKRQELVNRFQQADSHEKVFLISLKAGNAGLNLTAADYVFLFDPWWNTAVQQQAIDRTHRIGQTKTVFAYKMICKDTIEEKIMQLQQQKKKLAEELIGEEEGFVKALTETDIAFLFS